MLPWGAGKERAPFPAAVSVDVDTKPGEFVMRTLFAEFIVVAEKKIEAVVQEPIVSGQSEFPKFTQVVLNLPKYYLLLLFDHLLLFKFLFIFWLLFCK